MNLGFYKLLRVVAKHLRFPVRRSRFKYSAAVTGYQSVLVGLQLEVLDRRAKRTGYMKQTPWRTGGEWSSLSHPEHLLSGVKTRFIFGGLPAQ